MSNKKFKNSFGISGPKSLVEAFAKEAQLIGWTLQERCSNATNLYFADNNINGESLEPNHFWWCHSFSPKNKVYTLPAEYSIALEAASEIIKEVKPEEDIKIEDIVVCISEEGFSIDGCNYLKQEGIRVGDKLKVIEIGREYSNTGTGFFEFPNKEYKHPKSSFRKATKEESDKYILEEAIRKSGLKIGDIVTATELNEWGKDSKNCYWDNSWNYKAKWISTNRNIAGFEMVEGVPAIVMNDCSSGFYIRLEGFAECIKKIRDTQVIIGSYTAEIEGDKIAFGCQKINLQGLQTIRSLLNKEIHASITIHGTRITVHIIDKLIAKLQ